MDPSGDDGKLRDECGVIACVSAGDWPTKLDVANVIALGLVGLQHRGQECTGMATSDGDAHAPMRIHKGMGMVSNVFNPSVLGKMCGNLGIGHNRYSTMGNSELLNCQPFVVNMQYGVMAVAHNGELVNKSALRKEILNRGVGLSTGSDSELLIQLLCLPLDSENGQAVDIPGRLRAVMRRAPTSYSLVMLHGNAVYAARDPFGNRPLCIGKLCTDRHVDGWVVSSESCVFQSLGAQLVREVEPGEIIRVDKNGVRSICVVPRPAASSASAFCIFEYVYFARPDSVFQGQSVYGVRRRCGMRLAVEAPVDADVVSTVPESATPAALGFARQSAIPYEEVMAKNRYVGRTFIQPSTRLRRLAVARKFGVLRDNVRGRRVVIVDDSIVRGNTMEAIVGMLRQGGAREIHVRVASPPVRHPCYMGINIPTPHELLANRMSTDAIAKHIGADSLAYLSVDGLVVAVRGDDVTACDDEDGQLTENGRGEGGAKIEILGDNVMKKRMKGDNLGQCVACLTGNYPVPIDW